MPHISFDHQLPETKGDWLRAFSIKISGIAEWAIIGLCLSMATNAAY